LALALDESNVNDEIFSFDDFSFVIDKDTLAKTGPLSIDFNISGFSVNSDIFKPTENNCGHGCECHD
jgi:hypothetical protein